MSNNFFIELSQLDVNEHVEKKGRFNYLSWTWAVDRLKRFDHTATWEVIRFDGLPYLKTECGYFVEVSVTVQGLTESQIHPVLNNQNKPIAQPNAFEINTSIQRALVKAIAVATGLGLYIYSGEDLPNVEAESITPEQVGLIKVKAMKFAELRESTVDKVYEILKVENLEKVTNEEAAKYIKKLDNWISKAEGQQSA